MTTTQPVTEPTASQAPPRPVATVAAIYEAFGRGDVPAILTHLHPGVSWDADWADNHGQDGSVAHFVPRRGHDGVREFFGALAGCTVHDFSVLDLLSSDRQVVAQVVIDLELANGARVRDEELHLWTLDDDGLVTALRHYIDTAKHLAAARR